jgi:hypothetical protein
VKIEIKNFSENPVNALRRLGYSFQRKEGEEMSFIRPFSASGYPRFHMYVRLDKGILSVNFHLDMKKETYGEDTRHHGEYENEGVLAEEARRIKNILE